MKKASAKRPATVATTDADDVLPEYNFRGAKPNPYAARMKGDSVRVILDPDVAAHFPTSVQVNRALRALASNGAVPQRRRRKANGA